MSKLIYLSGGITGLTHGEAANWREQVGKVFTDMSNGQIRTLSPMRGKRYLDTGKPIDTFNDKNKKMLSHKESIYTRDRNDVKRCDLMLVNLLEAPRVSIGTCIEFGWADAFDKPIIVAMEETNIHSHPILNECANIIVPTLEDAVELSYHILRDDTF
jgi:nucleoside 2-deoxyribosyltransferase